MMFGLSFIVFAGVFKTPLKTKNKIKHISHHILSSVGSMATKIQLEP